MHENTRQILNWLDRMQSKYGYCGTISEALAQYCEEEGNVDPSDRAVSIALLWEENPKEIPLDLLTCNFPTWGCLYGGGRRCKHAFKPEPLVMDALPETKPQDVVE